MAKKFIISRNGDERLMVCWGDYRAEYVENDLKSWKCCLRNLGLDHSSSAMREKFEAALEQFYRLEKRSHAQFGKPKMFRIWRVDSKLLQVDFKGGYAELSDRAKSDTTLKQCLEAVGANQLLLGRFKRELAEFIRDEKGRDGQDRGR